MTAALLAVAPASWAVAQAADAAQRPLVVAQAPQAAPLPPLRTAPAVSVAPARAAAKSVGAPRPAPRPARIAQKAQDDKPARQRATLQPSGGAASGARPRASSGRAVQAAATIPALLSGDDPSLIGVFGGSDTRRALIRTPEGALRTVRQGDRLARWTVSAIGPDSVQLRDGARAQTLRVPGS